MGVSVFLDSIYNNFVECWGLPCPVFHTIFRKVLPTCHMSSVTYHTSTHFLKKYVFFVQSCEANWGRVCYQKGLSRLFFDNVQIKADFQMLHSKGSHPNKKMVHVQVLSEVGVGQVWILTFGGTFWFFLCLDIFQKEGGGDYIISNILSRKIEVFCTLVLKISEKYKGGGGGG